MQNKKDYIGKNILISGVDRKFKQYSPIKIALIHFTISCFWIVLVEIVRKTVLPDKFQFIFWFLMILYVAFVSIVAYLIIKKATKQIQNKSKVIEEINKDLKHSYSLISNAFESSPEIVVFSLDQNYCYTAFNSLHKATMLNIWGDEIKIGNSMLHYMTCEEDRGKAKANFDRALRGDSFTLEEEYGAECHERKYYKNFYSPTISREGDVIGLTCYVIDISHEKSLETENEYLIYHDDLTGLFNRRYYKHLPLDSGLPIAYIVCDVNGLKLINDAFGHLIGDQYLITVSEILTKCCQKNEIIARWGGDEFIIYMPNSSEEEAEQLIVDIKEECSHQEIRGIGISISFGFALKYRAEDAIKDVLKIAEDRMYNNKIIEGKSMRSNALHAIMATLHEKSPREKKHSIRVGTFCRDIGVMMQNREIDVERLQMCGYMHDIGKIVIDESILNKPDTLTDNEFDLIKNHSEIGCRILNASSEMKDIAEMVLYHHERWDGKGYPKGLKGESIPVYSRIIAIADAYDAMTSSRPYKAKMTIYNAVKEIIANAGTQFDPQIAKIFVENVIGLSWNENTKLLKKEIS